MAFITTPKQISKRGEFYHQLAVLISSGFPILKGLETVRRSPPHSSYIKPLQEVIQRLNDGSTFHEAVKSIPRWIPEFDQHLIEASENSGSLDGCFRLLADYCEKRAALLKRVMSNLIYPVLVLHFAVLIFPTSALTGLIFQGDVIRFLLQKGLVLIPIYACVAFILHACQSHHGERWRSLMEGIGSLIPMLRVARKEYALARLSMSLEALLRAGVPIINAWKLAAGTAGSPRMERGIKQWIPIWYSGRETPGESLLASNDYPDMFKNLYLTAESAGNLDETLHRLFLHYQEESARKMEILAAMAPRFFYLVIVVGVAYQIITFYSQYFNQIGEAGGF